MYITKDFLDTVGRRSPMARSCMVQAGDKLRVRALKKFLISIGACEITRDEIEELGLPVLEKRYAFLGGVLTYVLLEEELFKRFKPLLDPVALEVASLRNGVIGIRGGRYRDD